MSTALAVLAAFLLPEIGTAETLQRTRALPCHALLAVAGRPDWMQAIEVLRNEYRNPEAIQDIRLFPGRELQVVVRVLGQASAAPNYPVPPSAAGYFEVWGIRELTAPEGTRYIPHLKATIPIPKGLANRQIPVALSYDGEILAYPGNRSTVHLELLADLTSQKQIPSTIDIISPGERPNSQVTSVAFQPGTQVLAAGREDGQIMLLDPAARDKKIVTFVAGRHPGPVNDLVWARTPRLPMLASLSRGDKGKILRHFWDSAQELFPAHGKPTAIAISPDYQVAVVTDAGTIQVFGAPGLPIASVEVTSSMILELDTDPELFVRPGTFHFPSRKRLILVSNHQAKALEWRPQRSRVHSLALDHVENY